MTSLSSTRLPFSNSNHQSATLTWTESHLSIGVRVAIRYTHNRSNPPVRYGTIQKHACESVEDEFDDLFEVQLDEGGTLLMGGIEVGMAMELYTKYQKNDVFLMQGGQSSEKGTRTKLIKVDPFLEEYLCIVVRMENGDRCLHKLILECLY